jgi:hypothetical protein
MILAKKPLRIAFLFSLPFALTQVWAGQAKCGGQSLVELEAFANLAVYRADGLSR